MGAKKRIQVSLVCACPVKKLNVDLMIFLKRGKKGGGDELVQKVGNLGKRDQSRSQRRETFKCPVG